MAHTDRDSDGRTNGAPVPTKGRCASNLPKPLELRQAVRRKGRPERTLPSRQLRGKNGGDVMLDVLIDRYGERAILTVGVDRMAAELAHIQDVWEEPRSSG